MKQINNNCKEVLQALLNKTKTTTLRKAWKHPYRGLTYDNPREPDICAYCGKPIIDGDMSHDHSKEINEIVEKPCKHKVGEVVELVWTGEMDYLNKLCSRQRQGIIADLKEVSFGKAKIKSIENVEILRTNNEFFIIRYTEESKKLNKDGEEAHTSNSELASKLAKSKGFKSPEKMFAFLEEYAGGLETAKPFWLIEYEWVK